MRPAFRTESEGAKRGCKHGTEFLEAPYRALKILVFRGALYVYLPDTIWNERQSISAISPGNTRDGMCYYHVDMNEHIWWPIIGADKRVIGWMRWAEWEILFEGLKK